jgi:hypothetical protein
VFFGKAYAGAISKKKHRSKFFQSFGLKDGAFFEDKVYKGVLKCPMSLPMVFKLNMKRSETDQAGRSF